MLGQRLWRYILSSADVKSLDLVAQVSNLLVYDPRKQQVTRAGNTVCLSRVVLSTNGRSKVLDILQGMVDHFLLQERDPATNLCFSGTRRSSLSRDICPSNAGPASPVMHASDVFGSDLGPGTIWSDRLSRNKPNPTVDITFLLCR
jgi:hypothetical protein